MGLVYYYMEIGLFVVGIHFLICVKFGVLLWYMSGGWDFGWLIV